MGVLQCEASSKQRQLLIQAASRGTAQGVRSSKVVEEVFTNEELLSRLTAIIPVLQERVLAAEDGRQPQISGATRLRRNVAEHHGFGEGPSAVEGQVAVLKKKQRGRRKVGKSVSTVQASEYFEIGSQCSSDLDAGDASSGMLSQELGEVAANVLPSDVVAPPALPPL